MISIDITIGIAIDITIGFKYHIIYMYPLAKSPLKFTFPRSPFLVAIASVTWRILCIVTG